MAKTKKKLSQKWRFAIGTTSRFISDFDGLPVPDRHFLILDIDGPLTARNWKHILKFCPYAVIEKTEHGFHIYTCRFVTRSQFVTVARELGADKVWIDIGRKRGYWFLADRLRPVILTWKVERMLLNAR